jgi:hypothetical protein
MGRRYLVLMLGFLWAIGFAGSVVARSCGDLSDLARIHTEFKTKRVSSYDRTGGNNDRFENIKPGEVREIFNVKGAGMINHIWVTIAPPPEQLNRNDIILRMYWDGNPFASVESPIGAFFRTGMERELFLCQSAARRRAERRPSTCVVFRDAFFEWGENRDREPNG